MTFTLKGKIIFNLGYPIWFFMLWKFYNCHIQSYEDTIHKWMKSRGEWDLEWKNKAAQLFSFSPSPQHWSNHPKPPFLSQQFRFFTFWCAACILFCDTDTWCLWKRDYKSHSSAMVLSFHSMGECIYAMSMNINQYIPSVQAVLIRRKDVTV